MNLRDLRYLVAAADTQHFGQAAERCHISQPTLSGQIRKLEDSLDVVLFERSNRSVVLTDAGRDIAQYARRILEHARQLEEFAAARQDPLIGDLRIGIIPTLCAYLLPRLLPAMQNRHAGMHPILFEEKTARLLERLRAHEVDAVLVATRHDENDFESRVLFDEVLWVAVAADNPIATLTSVDRVALASQPLLTLTSGHCLADHIREICGIDGCQDHRMADLRATSLETLLQLVIAGYGITIVPDLVARFAQPAMQKQLVFLPLDMAGGFRQIRLVSRRTSSRIPAIEALAASVLDAIPWQGTVRNAETS